MASRTRQRVQTGRTVGTRGGQARAPPSAHLAAAKSILSSSPRSSPTGGARHSPSPRRQSPPSNRHARPGMKKPVGRMPEVDLSDLYNEFNLPPEEAHWNKNVKMPSNAPARSLAELKQKREAQRRPYLHAAVDIDGDGVIDEVEIQLSKLLDHIEGEDLDGDGVVTAEELLQTKIKKGKEILARQFVQQHPNIVQCWTDFKGLDDEGIVRAIVTSNDYRMLMSNLQNKAMQHELLYDSARIGNSLRVMATDRDRRWQMKKAQIAETRQKLFKAKYDATVNLHRQTKEQEVQHEKAHFKRQERSFTPMLKPTFLKHAGDLATHTGQATAYGAKSS